MDNNMVVSSAEEWRKPHTEGFLIQLPYSRKIVRVRPMGLDTVLSLGYIPNLLKDLIDDGLSGKPMKMPEVKSLQDMKDQLEVLDVICSGAIMEPEVLLIDPSDREGMRNLKPGQIAATHIDFLDKGWLLEMLNKPVEAFDSFRPEQERSVEPVQPGEEHSPESIGGSEPSDMDPEEVPPS